MVWSGSSLSSQPTEEGPTLKSRSVMELNNTENGAWVNQNQKANDFDKNLSVIEIWLLTFLSP